jgi:hypothetical protein
MPICISCPECGHQHPSRVRARSAFEFSHLNPNLGPVLEACPRCRTRSFVDGPGRRWHDAPLAAGPLASGRSRQA